MVFRIDIGRWKLRLKVFLNLPEVTKLVNGEVRITISYNFRHTISIVPIRCQYNSYKLIAVELDILASLD